MALHWKYACTWIPDTNVNSSFLKAWKVSHSVLFGPQKFLESFYNLCSVFQRKELLISYIMSANFHLVCM